LFLDQLADPKDLSIPYKAPRLKPWRFVLRSTAEILVPPTAVAISVMPPATAMIAVAVITAVIIAAIIPAVVVAAVIAAMIAAMIVRLLGDAGLFGFERMNSAA